LTSEQPKLPDERLEQLLEVGRTIVSELDLETLLLRVTEAARDLTGAAYAALGILNADKTGLERFLHSGIDEQKRREIGPLPRGRGVLGELIRNPRPLRLADVNTHARSYGFPPGHPEMKTFLGTPVLVRGEAWGNLYLTEKAGGEFEETDEQVAIVLAAWAGVAIENARLYEGIDRRREELEKALRGLEASSDIARTVSAGIELEELLELIVKRGRGVVGAKHAVLLLSDGAELVVAATAGEQPGTLDGRRLKDADTWLNDLQAEAPELRGLPSIVAELEFRDRHRGLLLAAGELGQDEFDASDKQVFDSFAAAAATTITTVQAVEAEKLQLSIEASERERHRWARELHDETLQELGALRVLLDSAGDDELSAESRRIAVEHVDRGIRNLQGLITELRPSVLDELGVGPAIESLARRSSERFGVDIHADVDIASEQPERPNRLPPELEATIYRLVQEAANNAIKHAEPDRIHVTVSRSEDVIEVIVADDGSGFDPDTAERSFGLVGMEERVSLLGGSLEIDSTPGKGTEVRADLPASPASPLRSARSPARR
jgi:signal transduction histidine kinase